jgi:uncharacterized membrane protein HdeD (DUF308 family)
MVAAGVLQALASHWWIWLVRGIIALVFGGLIVAWPGLAVGIFVILFAAYAFADGVMAAIAAFRTSEHRGWLILEAIVGIAVGVFVFMEPIVGLLTIAWVLAISIAVWAIVTGLFEIVLAVRLRKSIENDWFLIIVGALSVVLGVILLFDAGLALLAWVYFVAIYALIAGLGFIAFAFRLKSINDKIAPAAV